jgi:hypothetical protein
VIRAEAHTDDYVYSSDAPEEDNRTNFDATAWFIQANEGDIIALAKANWGGDYDADHVAEWSADGLPSVPLRNMFRYAEDSNEGFECRVNKDDAMAWLTKNRPEVARAVLAM